MIAQEQLDSFHRFASEQIEEGPTPLSLEELVEQWHIDQRSPGVHAADIAAIREALDDMNAGDTGEPAEEVVRALRKAIGLVGSQ